ncbi:hypothetical protein [Shinella oryzae]|uniref:Uncharacterized protein n=1 Tax=Shinella oryzae TaxID=2871820 RepID=A0ABY9K984_9HYPH|nr:hypothetical protein [Shinella oryzae]WLS05125.1 hypothetical protein Q9315_23470 [Shinella oryzae]
MADLKEPGDIAAENFISQAISTIVNGVQLLSWFSRVMNAYGKTF